MEGYDYQEIICPVCEAVIDRVIADWIVILDGDCPSSCDDGAMIRVRCSACGFPIFAKTVDAAYITHHAQKWPDWVEVVWAGEGDQDAKTLLSLCGHDRPCLSVSQDGEFGLGLSDYIAGKWYSTYISIVPAHDIREQSQRARRAVESLDAARAWLEANPPVDSAYGVDKLIHSYACVAPQLGLGDWRPDADSK
jgi:hypothetical protein